MGSQVIEKAREAAKSLRWLANMWPEVKAPASDVDKMCNCVHCYCERGADSIDELIKLAERRRDTCQG